MGDGAINKPLDPRCRPARIASNITFPDAYDAPPKLAEFAIIASVAGAIPRNFCDPVFCVPACEQLALSVNPIAPMPKIAVAEHGDALSSKDQIGTAWQRRDVRAETNTARPKSRSQEDLWSGILATIAGPHSARLRVARTVLVVARHRRGFFLGRHECWQLRGLAPFIGYRSRSLFIMPKVISLFSGAGGLDFGLEAAGFTFGAGVEMDTDCVSTLLESRPEWPVMPESIFDVPTAELLGRAGCKKSEIDLVAGGPPCQPFSKAGYWARGEAGRLSDPRSDTLGAYLRVVREALPKVLLLENVEGLKYAGKDEGLQLLIRELADINKKEKTSYIPHVAVLNAADYGVPQLRERVFVIAHREGRPFTFPPATHSPERVERDLLDGAADPYRTAWDALADVSNPDEEDLTVRGKWADLLPSIPEGSNYLHHTDRGEGMSLFGWRRRYWTFLLKLAKNRPSWTIQAQPGPAVGPFHWSNRRLSVRELSRLQTFPDDVNIVGGRGSAQKQLGNAVPSLLAEVIGRAIRQQLLDQPVDAGGLKLLPPRRTPIPPPGPVAAVPKRYHHLVGEHAAHPGTGLGHGATSRRVQQPGRRAEI
jgi:DNA (cytosine-5)-methyltransferase 1